MIDRLNDLYKNNTYTTLAHASNFYYNTDINAYNTKIGVVCQCFILCMVRNAHFLTEWYNVYSYIVKSTTV